MSEDIKVEYDTNTITTDFRLTNYASSSAEINNVPTWANLKDAAEALGCREVTVMVTTDDANRLWRDAGLGDGDAPIDRWVHNGIEIVSEIVSIGESMARGKR